MDKLVGLINKAQGDRTLNQYALHSGISKAMLSQIKKGTRKPSPDILQKLANKAYNNVSYRDFMVATEYLEPDFEQDVWTMDNLTSISTRKIPVIGSIACGEPIYANQEKELYVEVGSQIKADFILIAKGDSMINARIKNGDLVFIKQQSIVNNGEIAAVIIKDEATLKRVYYYPEEEKLILNAENPKYEPFFFSGKELENIIILGKAIGFQSDID